MGQAAGGSRVTRLTHVESPEVLPASAYEAVAVIRPAHREGEHLLGEGQGHLGGTGPGAPPPPLGLAGVPRAPTWSLSVCTRAAPLTHTGCRAPAILVTSPDVRDGLVESAGCDPGSHYRPAHVGRRGGLGHPEGWNSPAVPQPWLHSPALDWGFPRFLTTPLTWGGRGTGLPGWRPSYQSVSLRGGEGRAIREPPGRPSRLAMPWASAQAGQSCQWPGVPLALSLS